MITTLILISKILLIAWFLTRFEPIKWTLEAIFSESPKSLLSKSLYLLITCSKCIAFWSGLILSHNFFIAVIASGLMLFYEQKLSRWERQIIL